MGMGSYIKFAWRDAMERRLGGEGNSTMTHSADGAELRYHAADQRRGSYVRTGVFRTPS